MTGYTSELIEKDLSFEQFALLCARAFGATFSMCDDPLDASIPEAFEPSGYYAESEAKHRSALAELNTMNAREREDFGRRKQQEAIAYHEGAIAKAKVLRAKLEAQLAAIKAWVPPTPDHFELKKFMEDQVSQTISFDCDTSYHERGIQEAQEKSAPRYFEECHTAELRAIEYAIKEGKKDAERAAQRTAWVQSLRESLRPAPARQGSGPEREG